MKPFVALFHQDKVYIDRREYRTNEILTAYLNMDFEGLEWALNEFRCTWKRLMLSPDMDYGFAACNYLRELGHVQDCMDEADYKWRLYPPYDRTEEGEDQLEKLLQAHEMFFEEGGPSVLLDMWMADGDIFPREKLIEIMDDYNRALTDILEPYLFWLEDMVRVDRAYRLLLEKYLHVRHGFLSEREKAEQMAAFAQRTSLKIQGVISGGYTVYSPSAGESILCRRYQCNRIGDFLFIDFFHGLERNCLPKRCENCGTWFLLSGNYSDYCPDCRPTCARKSYAERVRNDPVWQTYNRAYKTHYARWTKGKMTAVEFEQWSRHAVELRDQAEAEKLPFAEYEMEIKK